MNLDLTRKQILVRSSSARSKKENTLDLIAAGRAASPLRRYRKPESVVRFDESDRGSGVMG
jgi:hypothetical protein